MKIPLSTPGMASKAAPHSRFIPREELSHFEAWAPNDLGLDSAPARPGDGGAPVRAGAPPDPLHAARQAGYQDGYRDGLVALEGFKQSHAANAAAQLGTLLASVAAQLEALQQAMADALVQTSTQLARQVVRSELSTRPELIANVAEQALDALMLSARHITVRVHPDDQALVAQGASDVLGARGARLIADAAVQRGGCVIESDLGRVDATIASRWKRAVAAIGSEREWSDEAGDTDTSADADADLKADAPSGAPTAPEGGP